MENPTDWATQIKTALVTYKVGGKLPILYVEGCLPVKMKLCKGNFGLGRTEQFEATARFAEGLSEGEYVAWRVVLHDVTIRAGLLTKAYHHADVTIRVPIDIEER